MKLPSCNRELCSSGGEHLVAGLLRFVVNDLGRKPGRPDVLSRGLFESANDIGREFPIAVAGPTVLEYLNEQRREF